MNQVIFINAPPAGSTITYTLDGVSAIASTTIPSGVHKLTSTIAVAGTAGAVTIRFGIGLQSAATATIKIYNVQFEAGAFATSYIPTTTTALTRNADVATMTGTNFSSWYNATEGALTVWFDSVSTGQGGVFSVNNGSSTQRIDYRGGTASGFVFINGSTMYLNVPPRNTLSKVCVAIKNTLFAGKITTVGLATSSAAIPTGLNTLNIGSLDSATNFVNGRIAKIFYYPQRLINAEVQAQVSI